MTTHPPTFDDAVRALRSGAVVAIPTDTVYGLAVDPSVPGATAALFALKGRPEDVDLPVLVADTAQFDGLVAPGPAADLARRLARAFWPGALTVVVPRRRGLDWTLGTHADTVGVRCPDHGVARRLCEVVGPLATTSANRHGAPPCTDAAGVVAQFAGSLGAVVDGGRCDRPPSTVVDVGGGIPRCLRAGALSWADVLAAADSV